jgi:hypothetical protein
MSENETKEVVEKDEAKVEATVEVKAEAPVQQVEEHKDDEKRMGVKEVVSNPEAMAIEKGKADVKPDEPEAKKDIRPSFFIDKTSTHRVEIDILSSKEDGKIMSVSRTGLGLNFKEDFDYLLHTEQWFDFSLPTYEDMSTYRTRCASYHREVGQMLVDKLQLRNYILVWHLKGWSLQDAEGNPVELVHDKDGSLSSDSMKWVYSLHPTIIDVILTIFEKDILLT